MPARAHSDTAHDTSSLEPSSSPGLEESERIISSGILTRYFSNTPIHEPSLESCYFPTFEKSVTVSVAIPYKPTVESLYVPAGKTSVFES